MSRNHGLSPRGLRQAAGSAAILLGLLLPPALLAEAVGYSANAQNDEIVELLLTQPGDRVPEARRLSFPGLGFVQGIELDPATGLLYVISTNAVSTTQLRVVDLEAETHTLLRSLGFVGAASDLAFDDSGLLWLNSSDGEIYSYEIETDNLILETTLAGDGPQGLAWWDGRLYGLFGGPGGTDVPSLAVIDPVTGALSESRDLPALAGDDFELHFMDSLDLDAGGGMWIGFVSTPGIVDPPLYFGKTAYFSDPLVDAVPEIRQLQSEVWLTVPLVVTGQVTPIVVPALGPWGLGLLMAFLAFAGALALRRTEPRA